MARSLFTGVTDYFGEIARMRELASRPGFGSGYEEERVAATAWVPAADIFARGDAAVIRVELAGMTSADVDISVASGLLTVSGERQTEGGADPDSFSVRERFHGAFRRVFMLPEGTTPEDVTASFAEGLVEIVIAGGSAQQAERIDVADRSTPPTSRRLG